jgi:hypothetical protein
MSTQIRLYFQILEEDFQSQNAESFLSNCIKLRNFHQHHGEKSNFIDYFAEKISENALFFVNFVDVLKSKIHEESSDIFYFCSLCLNSGYGCQTDLQNAILHYQKSFDDDQR